MILQALYDYYQRKSADTESGIAPPGFEVKEIPFLLVIDKEGRLLNIEDTREGEGRQIRAKKFLVPHSVKKSSNITANLLWDSAEYVLGISIKTKKADRLAQMHHSFIERIEKELGDVEDEALSALKRYLRNINEQEILHNRAWEDIREINPFISFRFYNDINLICQRDAICKSLNANKSNDHAVNLCMITGEKGPTEILHPTIKGIYGAQSTGANIVSFNLDAFKSFNKEQGRNAPVGKNAAFAYTTALNYLLRRDSRQKLIVGEATMVFWADRPHDLEMQLADIFGEPPKDDPDRQINAVRSLYRSLEVGAFINTQEKTKFFVLGLSPNAARIAIRFWNVSTAAELAERIKQHFEDLRIVRRTFGKNFDPEFLSLFRILVSVAIQGKAANIIPNMSGDIMRAILDGTPYPRTLLNAALRRIRASHEVTYAAASIIKAYLNRQARSTINKEKEVSIMLDEGNRNIGYRLGRLFAVLEKAQEEANPGLNATIRDRYYGAASSTPVTVYPILMKLKNHHIAKLENRGRAVNFERLFGNIIDEMIDFPAHLDIEDQGRFAVGYYHQRQEFFKKSQKED
jgi:CRISPR-associated protein Csd1